MADTKITGLAAIGANPIIPSTFPLPMVDLTDTSMAASGTTKKVTVNQILGAGGTATLASATITGDLTCNSNVNVGASPTFFGGKIATNGHIAISAGNYLKLWNSTGTGVAGINASAADTLNFALTNAFTTAMTLNSTGLGVGTSNFAYKLNAAGFIAAVDPSFTGTGGSLIGAMLNNDNTAPGLDIRRWTGTAGTHGTTYICTDSTGSTFFYNGQQASNTKATSLKMTLDASGNLLVGTTSAAAKITALAGASGQAAIFQQPAQNFWCVLAHNQATSGDNSFVLFGTEASFTSRGSITYNRAAGQVAYNITSDYRLKEDIKPLTGAISRITSLKPSTYKLKETGFVCEGFIAHELAEVVPMAVSGAKDAVDADGKPVYQSVDLSKVIPLLVAAIKELTARVEALEA